MSTLRAAAFLSWLIAILGLALRWDAMNDALGGILVNKQTDKVVGLVLASTFSILAVALHILEFFQTRRDKSRGNLCE